MLYNDYPEAQITNETKGQFLEAKERKKKMIILKSTLKIINNLSLAIYSSY